MKLTFAGGCFRRHTARQRTSTRHDQHPPGQRRHKGSGAVEFLVAVPVMLLIGLLVWQWALILQARQIVDQAVREAARSGALGHAEPAAIEQGLVTGLASLWLGSREIGSRDAMLAASALAFGAATRAGWLDWRQLTPTRESFADWGMPPDRNRADSGGASVLEIPIDNPSWRMRHAEPATGSVGSVGTERIGASSGQTFREAGILRVELSIGVPLEVPLAGRFVSWAARSLLGCQGADLSQLGAIRLDAGRVAHPGEIVAAADRPVGDSRAPSCAFYGGGEATGHHQPRLLLRVAAEARMQSNARLTGRTPAVVRVPGRSAQVGPVPDSAMSTAGSAQPPIADPGDSSEPKSDEGPDRSSGFLRIGAGREIWSPGSCGIPPS